MSSVQDGVYTVEKAQPFLRRFLTDAFETVPVLVYLTMTLSRPLKETVPVLVYLTMTLSRPLKETVPVLV